MDKPITLKSYQQEALDFISKRDRTLLVLPTGSGKTITSLYAICNTNLVPPRHKVIIVTIASVVYQFAGEAELHTQDYKVFSTSNGNSSLSKKKREDLYQAFVSCPTPAILVLNYNLLRNDIHYLYNLNLQGYDVIIDEASNTSNNQTKNYISVKHLSYKANKMIAMTASAKNPIAINNMSRAIGVEKFTTEDIIRNFCYTKRKKVARNRYIRDIVGFKNLNTFNATMSHIFVKTKEEILPELPAFINKVYDINFTTDHKKALTVVQEKSTTPFPPVSWILASTTINHRILDQEEKKKKHTPHKFDEIIKLIEREEDTKFVIFSEYKTIVKAFGDYLDTKNNDYTYTYITSDHPISNKDKFIKDKNCRLLLATTALSHGVDGLQKVCSDMIFLTPTIDAELFQQISGRLSRIGAVGTHGIILHHFICGDFERAVYSSLHNKLHSIQKLNKTVDQGMIDETALTQEDIEDEDIIFRKIGDFVSLYAYRRKTAKSSPTKKEENKQKLGDFS